MDGYDTKSGILKKKKKKQDNHLDGDPAIKAWDQEVCFLCGLRFEPCGYSYGHWKLTWSLISRFVRSVKRRVN